MRCPVFLLLFCLLTASTVVAQRDKGSWQQLWQELMAPEDIEGEEQVESDFELLNELAEHPIDLNRATREELEKLPFLSAQQVMDFMEYRDRYGPLRSMGELRMIKSLDYQQIALLPYFTRVGEVAEESRFPSLKTMGQYGKHQLTAAIRLPLYSRKGDQNGYLGYKYRHWTRYEFNYGDYVRFGLVGSQDAGEPFFAGRNRWGYDVYSYYLQMKHLGRLEHLIVGKYKMSVGMGVVLGNAFALGKMNVLQDLGRPKNILSVHASRSTADYYQGVAATLTIAKPLRFTAFLSHRPFDATLNKDGSVATLLQTNYHRTPGEMAKKDNTRQTVMGGHLDYRYQRLHLGGTVVYSRFDRSLQPNVSTLYRRYAPTGHRFLNTSVNYAYLHHRCSFSGETAFDTNGAMATVNTLSYQSPSSWSLVALHRFYSYRYNSLHGHAFSEGGHVQNENGFLLGGTWQPTAKLQLRGYADITYFPWARYRVSQSSWSKDFLSEISCQPWSEWTVKGRYRLRLRQLDNQSKTALRRHNEHRVRLSLGYEQKTWGTTMQADMVRAVNYAIEQGWMLSERLSLKHAWWQMTLMGAYFRTDGYDSRLYIYERQLPHEYSFSMFYGRGMRLALVGRASIGSKLQLDAKVGHTRYFNRQTIGSALQEVNASYLTDLDLQVRWQF